MSRPYLVAQLRDFHIGAVWAEGDPELAVIQVRARGGPDTDLL